MRIGERIFQIIDNSNKSLTITGLSKHTGIRTGTISGWRKPNRNPSSEYIASICEYLGVSCGYLLTGKEKTPADGEGIEPEFRKLIDKFAQLNPPARRQVIGYIEGIMSDESNLTAAAKEVTAAHARAGL